MNRKSLVLEWIRIVFGLLVFAFGVHMTIYANIGLGKRMSRIPIGIVEVMLWAVVLLAGYLLGGSVGIGTLISTFGAGLVMQLVYYLIKFEPRDLKHKGVIEVSKVLVGK
ncbi:MAG: hypothetical protein IJV15_12180 [Lachnospiraceae bacterium]|nr:hypothetical protein [Lachnospiraceae bacterium]